MAENARNVYDKSDEIDLIALVEKIVSFFKSYGRLLISFAIGGMILGILMYFIVPKQYSSKLILHSVILTNPEQIQIIGTWKELLRKGEYNTLAANLNCDPAILKKLGKITAEEIQKLYVQNNPHGFTVSVLVKDTSILNELQKGIVYGLENTEYIKERVAIKKSNLNQLIEKVNSEIIKLDSTKANVESIMSNKSQTGSSLMIDVTGINSQMIGLNEKLLAYKEELQFVNAVQVLQSFNKHSKPEKPKLVKNIFLGIIAGTFIGYVVALFKYVRRKLSRRAYIRSQAA